MQDLWADFADEARTTAEAGRSGGLRQRRLTEQTVLMALRTWLLQDYLLPYGTSLGATRIFKRCYWIDALGNTRQPAPAQGEAIDTPTGKRGRQSVPREAIPLALQLATSTARELASLDRPITLHPFFLDEKHAPRKGGKGQRAGRDTFSQQMQQGEASPRARKNNGASAARKGAEIAGQGRNGTEASIALTLPKEGGVLPACWPELASGLLAALEQSAAIFLLNPLKDGLFRYTDLLPLYQRAAPTEIFLWLPHKQIETRLLPGLRTTEGAAALTNLLRGDRWKGLLAQEAERPERIVPGLVELLVESMRPHFLSVQHLTLPMLSGPATVEAVPYSLLFATRRQDSLYSLNDAVCLRTQHLLAESQRGVLSEEWFAAQREEQAVARRDALTQELLALGRLQRARRWPDLRQNLLLAHFGQHTLADYDAVITRLLTRGDVRCEWRKRSPENGETAIPGPDDLLFWK